MALIISSTTGYLLVLQSAAIPTLIPPSTILPRLFITAMAPMSQGPIHMATSIIYQIIFPSTLTMTASWIPPALYFRRMLTIRTSTAKETIITKLFTSRKMVQKPATRCYTIHKVRASSISALQKLIYHIPSAMDGIWKPE